MINKYEPTKEETWNRFEYEVIQREILRNSNMSYTIMALTFTFGLGLFAWIIKDSQNFYSALFAGIILFIFLILGYGIDRRLTYVNRILVGRLIIIEKNYGIFNFRLVKQYEEDSTVRNKDTRVLPPELFKIIDDEAKLEEGFWSKKRIHDCFFGMIILLLIFWLTYLYVLLPGPIPWPLWAI